MVRLNVKVTGLDELLADLNRIGANPREVMRRSDPAVAALIKSETEALASSRARNIGRAARSNKYEPRADGIHVQMGDAGASNKSDLSWAAAAQQGSPWPHGFKKRIATDYTTTPAVKADRRGIAEPWLDALAAELERS